MSDLSNYNNINTYATMSIFAIKAPRLLDYIEKAVKEENIADIEYHASKLIVYSSNACLEGFTQVTKNLIIAARENKIDLVREHSTFLKESFERMTKAVSLSCD